MHAGISIAMMTANEAGDGGQRWLAAGLALLTALLMVRVLRHVRGTTLAAPALWAVAACLAMAGSEALLGARPDLEHTVTASLVCYAARVGMFCPLMAVLGAKRPQDRGWQWVVLSLWIVLLAPAAQAWAAHTEGPLELHALWKFMILALELSGPFNYLATSWCIQSLLVCGAQVSLVTLSEPTTFEAPQVWPAYLLLIAATVLPPLPWRLDKRVEPAGPLAQFSQRWRAFRNGWGAFWGLRIQNRVNESARLGGWPVRLAWSGFVPLDGAKEAPLDDRDVAQIQQTIDSLLRRFERLGDCPIGIV